MPSLFDFRWGLERETHRLSPDGGLSQAPHPEALGLPFFTRDFAETQLEIITRSHGCFQEALEELERLTGEARRVVAPEWLWPLSVPPPLPADSEVPVARLGSGEQERRAVAYRQGLARRYGVQRQMICGVHVNVSLGPALLARITRESPPTAEEAETGDPRSALHLRLARHLYRDLPVLVLLFGASPFRGGGGPHPGPLAISYRNSSFGYARNEYKPFLDLSSLDDYVAGIRSGLSTESSEMAHHGLVEDGRVVQLNPNVFQTDKEFYAPIRLRQSPRPEESALDALSGRGIGLLEIRVPDVDPFHPAGIGEPTLSLLHLFLLDGLIRPSIPRNNADLRFDLDFAEEVALSDPLRLKGNPVLYVARDRLQRLEPWAAHLDRHSGGTSWSHGLSTFQGRIASPEELPAARLARFAGRSVTEWNARELDGAPWHPRTAKGAMHGLEYAGV